jgi:thiamine pyrophosphate-dependent acetolactate synthase large subunit-like protein
MPPVLALSGDMPRKMHGTDFFQTTEPDLLFRDVSAYTETISSPAQAPAVIHQAIAAAYACRGVAHLTLPQDVISARAAARETGNLVLLNDPLAQVKISKRKWSGHPSSGAHDELVITERDPP